MRKLVASFLALVLALSPVAGSTATLDLFGTSYVFENGLSNSALTPGDCVQAGVGGLFTTTAAACGSGNGTVTAVTGSGNLASSGGTTPNITISNTPTFTGTLTAGGLVTAGAVQGATVTGTGLTTGDCLQAGAGGVITSTAAACASAGVTSVTASGNLASSGGTTPNISITNAPTFSGNLSALNVTDTSLTSGNCVQATTGGLLMTIVGACGVGSGTVTAVTGTSPIVSSGGTAPAISCATCVTGVTGSGNITSSGGTTPNIAEVASPTYTSVTAGNITDTSLSPGGCVQAGVGGLLTTSAPCAALTAASFVIPPLDTAVTVTTTTPVTFVKGVPITINDGTNSASGFVNTSVSAATSFSFTSVFVPIGAVGNTMASGASINDGDSHVTTGALTSGDCLQATGTGGLITTTASPCGTGSGTVTSVTSANSLLSVATGTTTPVLTVNETPTFTGTVTAPTFTSTSSLSSALTYSATGFGCVESLNTELAYSGFGSCVASTGATFVIPAIGSSVTVTQQTGQFITDDYFGEPFTITDGTHVISGHVTSFTSSGLSFPFTVDSITAGTVGNTMALAAQIYSGGISSAAANPVTAVTASGGAASSGGTTPNITVTNPVTATAPTQQNFLTGAGTYTTPAGVKWIEIRAVGAGGGSSGDGTGAGNGGAGGNTTFGTTLIVANGGAGGAYITGSGPGGVGGTASLGTALGLSVSGGNGDGSTFAVTNAAGARGGATCLGGSTGTPGSVNPSTGIAGAANTGGGASGPGTFTAITSGTAGGGGGCAIAHINAPLATYAYSVGAGGTAGAVGGAGGSAGAIGGSGGIWVTEHYNY